MSSFFLKKIMALARNEFHYQHQKLYNHLNKPGRWAIAPKTVINAAICSNPNLTYYTLNTPPTPRICYEVRNRYSGVVHNAAIEILENELDRFIRENEHICAFEPWMLSEV